MFLPESTTDTRAVLAATLRERLVVLSNILPRNSELNCPMTARTLNLAPNRVSVTVEWDRFDVMNYELAKFIKWPVKRTTV